MSLPHAAGILREMILTALAPHRLSVALAPTFSALSGFRGHGDERLAPSLDMCGSISDSMLFDNLDRGEAAEELRCVLAVIRHGDRTPKQKMKMKITFPSFLALFEKHQDPKGRQAKLKTPLQLQELLEVTTRTIESEGAALVDNQTSLDSKDVEERVRQERTSLIDLNC